MQREKILDQIKESFGMVPGFMSGMPDAVLEQYWSTTQWLLSDTGMPSRDKALVAFGAATAIHCRY